MREILKRAAEHKGTAYVEIYQNCNIFNDKAFAYMTDKQVRDDQTIHLEHGQPMIFGKERDKGIRLSGTQLEVFDLAEGGEEACLVWNEEDPNPAMACMLAQLTPAPTSRTPIGVLRSVEEPVYDTETVAQIQREIESKGEGKLEDLVYAGEVWEVAEDGSISAGSVGRTESKPVPGGRGRTVEVV